MDLEKIKNIKKKLIKNLDAERYSHTIGVADTSFALALRYGADAEKAYLAGLLHDCAKCLDNDKKFALCEKYGVELSDVERENPFLIHAKLGAVLAKEKYEIDDEEIADAIRYHTTGKAGMKLLEKIVFSADYIEPGRKDIPGLNEIRECIFNDFDKGVYLIYEGTLRHLKNKNQPIDDTSREAYEYYKKQTEGTESVIEMIRRRTV